MQPPAFPGLSRTAFGGARFIAPWLLSGWTALELTAWLYALWLQDPRKHVGFVPFGLRCGGPEDQWSTSATTTFCNPVPVFYQPHHAPGADIYSTFYESELVNAGTDPDTFSGKYAETWQRADGWDQPAHGNDPLWWPAPVPTPVAPPMLDPLSNPVPGTYPGPAPTPQSAPYPAIPGIRPNPWRSPVEQPHVGNGPIASPDPAVSPTPGPVVPPVEPPPHRPPPRTKERKLTVRQAAVLGWALSVTEANDFVDAVWDALPDQDKTGGGKKDPRITDKYKDVYRHWQDIPLEQAVENVVLNAIEDAIFGEVQRAIQAGMLKDKPYWAQKWAGPEGEFEQDLAVWVEDQFGQPVRDFIEIEGDPTLGDLW